MANDFDSHSSERSWHRQPVAHKLPVSPVESMAAAKGESLRTSGRLAELATVNPEVSGGREQMLNVMHSCQVQKQCCF
jgi:hypothetical protein